MSVEDQVTISAWAQDTFGPVGSNILVAARANQEMAELLMALAANESHPKAAEEIADIFIVLYRLMGRLGAGVQEEIDKKMAINRTRKWLLDGVGQGYHVREGKSEE
jgi:NTP pyrophosphatase (non-canonical NTP hydrolase)